MEVDYLSFNFLILSIWYSYRASWTDSFAGHKIQEEQNFKEQKYKNICKRNRKGFEEEAQDFLECDFFLQIGEHGHISVNWG
jgi:hypothetical protein